MNMDILISGIKSKFKCLRVRLIRNLDKLKKKGIKRVMGISNFAKKPPPPPRPPSLLVPTLVLTEQHFQ